MPFIQNRSESHPVGLGDDRSEQSSSAKFESDQVRVGVPNDLSSPVINASQDPLAGALLGLSDVITKTLITHPCSVMRRQCQVHQFARCLHITPLTLVPVICNAVAKEGLQTLWKGSIGSCVVWGLSSVTEIVVGDLFGLPRTYIIHGSSEKYWRHLFLKASCFCLTTPFYVSSFIETVRSESGLGSDDNRVMDVILKGIDRMKFTIFSSREPSRRFSIMHLAVPTVGYRTSHYVVQMALYHQFHKMARRYVNRKPESERTKFHEFVPQIFAQMSSGVLTDLIFYPVETILHRMYIQGTRTLIDNMDTGLSAVSMTVKYNGFFDCLKQIVENEGFWALYAGVGALALEYLLHSSLQQLVRACFDHGSEMLRKATAGHQAPQSASLTPPISAKNSFSGPMSGAFSSPIPTQKPKVLTITSPPRDPTQFPTFGETVSQFNGSYGNLHESSSRPNVFGSPPSSIRPWQTSKDRKKEQGSAFPPLMLSTDTHEDPFSG